MNDWNLWKNSKETKKILKILEDELKELDSIITEGYLLKHDQADRIAVDYAHKVGAREGILKAIQILTEAGDSNA